MKAYLDSEDSYYRYNEESVIEELIKSKPKKDFAGIGAIIFMFTVLSIVIGLIIAFAVYNTAIYGQTLDNQTEPKGVFKSKAFTVKDLKTVKLDNRYEIQGTIKNISNESITGIRMYAETYNATCNYNGVVINPIDHTMEPGQEYSFSIPVYTLIGDLDLYHNYVVR
jgi:hypothetical protein